MHFHLSRNKMIKLINKSAEPNVDGVDISKKSNIKV